jgi:zinc finger SWIM domain-containing protein 3
VPFVGLNHHRSTVIFGCGIISHETTEAYEWMLEVFSEAMSQKHPISVITDGDLAMQRAIRVIWSDSNHRLCVWHIQQNIVRHLSDDKVKEEFRSFIYDSSSIAEHESKWLDFLERNKVTSEESWLHQMYQMRKLWCAPYLAGRCFLGLSSNQRSESLNSVLHTHLSSQMTLFKMLEHYERCLSTRRLNETVLNIVSLQSVPYTEPDASSLEVHAAMVFTSSVFKLVRYSLDAVSKCFMSNILDGSDLDGSDLVTFVVAKKDRREKKFEVRCVEKQGSPYRISCSCRKLECVGTPCSHILYVLGTIKAKELPMCCVPTRWTMSARSAYPLPSRNSGMYDYSKSLMRYRELRKLSHAACFRACQSDEAYHRLEMVLKAPDDSMESTSGQNESIRFGPVLPLTEQTVPGDLGKVLDPLCVQGRGAPKKRLQAKMKKPRSKGKCGYCGDEGHNVRTCKKLKEVENISDLVSCVCISH